MKDFGEIFILLLATCGIFVLTWLTTRFLSKRLPGGTRTQNMQVVEKISMGRDRHIALVKVGGEHFMVGVTGQHITFSPAVKLPANETVEYAGSETK